MCLVFALVLWWVATASAKLSSIDVEIIRTKTGQWNYVVTTNDKPLKSDEELADYLSK